MPFKVILTFCSSAILVQCITGQCIGAYEGTARAASVAPLAGITASTGGGLVVSSASPVAPVGVSVVSDNAIEGALAVGGSLPYLGAVALEAAIPTVGAGAVGYGCGNGAVAITTEDIGAIGFAGIAGPMGYVPGITGPIAPGLARPIGLASRCSYGAVL